MKVLIIGLLCSVFVFPALRTERLDSLRDKEQRLVERLAEVRKAIKAETLAIQDKCSHAKKTLTGNIALSWYECDHCGKTFDSMTTKQRLELEASEAGGRVKTYDPKSYGED